MDIVAIVGRPNVGKSTLYNRLIGEKQSIVDNQSGVTRDRQYGESHWNGKEFAVVDTGGFVRNSEDVFEAAIRDQVGIAIDEAKVILFMVDVSTGITDLDEQVARMLRKANKPVFLVVNKVDNNARQLEASEFWGMGFEDTFYLSSVTGSGSGELLDAVVEHIQTYEPDENALPQIAIVGQPNAGKSSFINALLGEERNIVTDIAGTTRDTINSYYNKYGHEFNLIDTAGIRKKAKVYENLEFYSVMRAIKAIEKADVVVLMIDATDGVESQDLAIFRIAQKRNKGIVLAINKWDLVDNKETNTMRDQENEIRQRFAPLHRPADHFHERARKAAHHEDRGGYDESLRKPEPPHHHLQAQRCTTEVHRTIQPTELPGAGNQYQIHYPTTDRLPRVCLLLQPPATYEGELPELPGKPDSLQLRFYRGAYFYLFPQEVKGVG